MKIQSTKLEGKNQQSDQDLSTANTSTNVALFDQLFQLLTQIAVPIEPMNMSDISVDSNSIEDQTQADANKINNFNNLMDASINNLDNADTINKNSDDISLLMQQVSQTDNKQDANISAILEQKDKFNQINNKQNKNIRELLSENQIDDKALNKIVNNELNADNINAVFKENDTNDLQTNGNIQNILMSQTNTSIELNDKKINLNNFPANLRVDSQKTIKAMENKSGSTTKDNTQITLNSDASEVVTSTQLNDPFTLNLDNQTNNINDDKLMNAFVSLGHLINNHTLPGDNSSRLSNQVQADLQATESNHFDPLHDVKFEIVTGNPLNPEKLLQQVYNANIKIYPPELGNVIAKLKIEKNNAELLILTENNQVKQIVESNLPLLKQHFENSDINLVQINVQSGQTGGESNQNQEDKPRYSTEHQHNQSNTSTQIAKSSNKSKNAIIDTYA